MGNEFKRFSVDLEEHIFAAVDSLKAETRLHQPPPN